MEFQSSKHPQEMTLKPQILILLLFLATAPITVALGQAQDSSSFMNQLVNDLKSKARFYRKTVILEHPMFWDTTDFVFKHYLSKFDTTDQTDIAVKQRSLLRKISAFMKLVDDTDYRAFKDQAANAFFPTQFDFAQTIKGNKKVRETLTVRFSQPLYSSDGRMAIIKVSRVISISGGGSDSTVVYIKNGDTWVVWGWIEKRENTVF